ncbi:hypothetical protein NUH16_009163 [Penicillium rubens]|jgi:hypothetical protein|uniref:uncharacterized protein n=1 Tax=Penicillium rubens TaxID=1108849 RepID=UPI002A5AE59A|nr:uncharacterized protein N7525_000913 [Penicillium rubens]KAJ5039381.1 hypothetical protein NUH16_009163 [Penicillium rubens]KAJ5843172.1 hypothetical protein N7525_000913 [Penicillium rubens]
MAHGHFRHSRIGNLISARRRREAELDGQDAGSDLLEDDTFQSPILPATGMPPEENCDSSKTSMRLEHGMNEFDSMLEKRDEAASPDPTSIETVLQIVDASSQTPLQSTTTDFPMTASDSTYATDTLPSSDSLPASATASATTTATATESASASVDLGLLTSPTASPLSETSLTNTTNVAQTSSTTNAVTQLPSPLRSPSAAVISSPAWSSTRLVTSSISTPSLTTTSSQVHNHSSYSGTGSDSSSSSTSTSSTSSSYTTSSSNVYGGSESAGSPTGTGTAPTTSETQGSGQGSTSNPATPKIVGGVVGSVAGVALILFLLFYYLRRRGFFMGKMGRPTMLGDAAAGAGAGARSREVVERRESNDPLFTASYLAPAFMKRWRQSTATTRSGSTVDSAPSERGFQKISGRKLPPVFTHGGDGYGGGLDGDSPTITGFPATSPASGPIGSPSFYAPPPAQPYGMPLDSNYTREVEEHTPPAQPNPVHLPISNAVSVATPITVTPAQPIAQPQSAVPFAPPRPDGLGRSLHSFDGSRSSRFTEVMDQ